MLQKYKNSKIGMLPRKKCDPAVMFFEKPPSRKTDLAPNVSYYSPRVLVNNWTEDRVSFQKLTPEVQHYKTVYGSDYCTPCPYTPRDHKDLLDRIIQHGGHGHDMLLTHEDDKYQKNISTTYDLMHNHFPKFPLKRKCPSFPRFIPRSNPHEMLDSYGNITKYGLIDYKRAMWDLEEKGKNLKNSEYMSRYLAPKLEDFESVRVAVTKSLSSALYDMNKKNKDLPLRGARVSLVPNGYVDVERYRATCGMSCLDVETGDRLRARCPPC